jgi:hypothetical protein
LPKKEYVNHIGAPDIFAKLLLATAIKNGYGHHKTTVLLTDGASPNRNMMLKYFKEAI